MIHDTAFITFVAQISRLAAAYALQTISGVTGACARKHVEVMYIKLQPYFGSKIRITHRWLAKISRMLVEQD